MVSVGRGVELRLGRWGTSWGGYWQGRFWSWCLPCIIKLVLPSHHCLSGAGIMPGATASWSAWRLL